MNVPGTVPLGGLLGKQENKDPNQLYQEKMIKWMNAAGESCPTKTAIAGVGGFVLGGMFGLFMSSMRYDVPTSVAAPGSTVAGLADLPVREQLRHGLKDMGRSSYSQAKTFGMIGAIYAGIECCIEGLRAKNDLTNSMAAGCLTGGWLARAAGPQAACIGCAGFAAFSAAIDSYMRMPGEGTGGPIE